MFIRRLAVGTAAALIASLGVAATPAVASQSGASTCGSGYSYLTQTTDGRYAGGGNGNIGALRLYVNTSSNHICAIYQKAKDYGKATPVTVYININRGATIKNDSGNYKYYAGPVILSYGGRTQAAINSLSIGGLQNVGARQYAFYDNNFTNSNWRAALK